MKGLGCACNVVKSTELANNTYTPLSMPKAWESIIGVAPQNVVIMLAAREGQGKTTLALKFGHDFVKSGNGQVLYVTSEQFGSPIFVEQVARLKAAHEGLKIANKLPDDLAQYNLIIIDSTNDSHMTDKDIEDLREEYPDKAFMFIVRQNQDKTYRGIGATDMAYDADIVIEISKGIATNTKNRCGVCGEMDIFNY